VGSGDIRRWLFAAVLAVCCAAGASSASADTAPTREQVRAAAEKVRADPNMPGVKTEKKLRFKERDDDEEEEPEKKTDSLETGCATS